MELEEKTELCNAIYNYYLENPSGGWLHIVLDDGNLEDYNIQWCLENSIKENKDYKAKKIAEMLLKLSYGKRKRLYNNRWKS